MPERKRFFDRVRDFFEDIEKDVFEAFGGVFEDKCSWDPEQCCLEPLTNIIETEQEFIITADLPFVKREDIELNVTDDMLDLDAKLDKPVKFAQWGTIQRGTEFCSFHKHIKLTSNLESDKVSATFKRGILKITIPKNVKRFKVPID